MRRREDKRQVERRREATRNKVAAAVENFDDDVVFIKEVKRKISPATSSPPGFRNRRQKQKQRKQEQRPVQPVGPTRRPIPTLADFMPTPPGSESEDWDRDIAREQDAREALAAARGEI